MLGALLPHTLSFHSYFQLVNLIPNTLRSLDHLVTLVLKLDLEVTEHQDLEICNSPTLKKKNTKKPPKTQVK